MNHITFSKTHIQYAKKNYADMGIALTALGTYIPAKRRGITDFADFVLANNSINNHYAALNESYRLLKIPLQQYSAIERSGGWPLILYGRGRKLTRLTNNLFFEDGRLRSIMERMSAFLMSPAAVSMSRPDNPWVKADLVRPRLSRWRLS